MVTFPAEVETFDPSATIIDNFVGEVFGQAKTGKSFLGVNGPRPLYIVHLDPNDNMRDNLLKAQAAGFEGDVKHLVLRTLPYEMLTVEEALRRVTLIQEFGAAARAQSYEDKGGLFFLDGGVMLKGYFEKAYLGESATLGYRAQKGQRGGPSQIEYGATNALLREFITEFVGQPLDFLIAYEGRRKWDVVYEEDAGGRTRKTRQPTETFITAAPERTAFAIKAQLETIKVRRRIVVDNEVVGTVIDNKVLVHWNGYNPAFEGMVLPMEDRAIRGIGEVIEFLRSGVPQPAAPVERVVEGE